MFNIVLIGMSGTGKTTVGKKLAAELGMEFCDIDSELEKAAGMPITRYFTEYGEARFREEEAAFVKRITRRENCVISTGGGVVLKRENIENLREKGLLVCLTARPEAILNRIRHLTDRPLVHHGDPYQNIVRLLEARDSLYRQADICLDTSDHDPEETVAEIIARIKESDRQQRN